ncbi:NUDIX hydrolase [Nakamurella endophytica]|uniref:Exopolyphosphatase n=1 Tax=Nakamurella endophytica TaxID=1748367 RepID=A0A917WLY8_9ACTN|nr:NUDIX domain-containing protein [Nakamurella endophytica]GGM14046.1 exopolyphosphatase [Nakamurella endophytica]
MVALLVAALRLWSTANRLDRLHVRTEAAWAALDGALSRRVAAVRVAAAAGAWDPVAAEELRALTAVADRAPRPVRADAENDLTRALDRLPRVAAPELAGELVDAAERISLARSFYNDAVRDTRALRERWFTRLFRLAGRAQLPAYFEIADPTGPGRRRSSARVVLVDRDGRTLLFSAADPTGRTVWFTPGGGVEAGEDLLTAARRELAEETGLTLPAEALGGPLWRREAQFVFAGVPYDQVEYYYAALAPDGHGIDTAGFTDLEVESISGHRWWTEDDLRSTGDPVYPVELADRLGEALAAAVQPQRVPAGTVAAIR